MDPMEALRLAIQELRNGDTRAAANHLDDYYNWRKSGGFEPKGGDKKAAWIWKAIMVHRPKLRMPRKTNPVSPPLNLRFDQVMRSLRLQGLTISRRAGEYRVAFVGRGNEASAYYTPDLDDAYMSGMAMARKKNPKRRHKKMPITPEDRGILRAMVREHGATAIGTAIGRYVPVRKPRITSRVKAKQIIAQHKRLKVFNQRRAKKRNPVRITSPRAGSKRQFRVYTRKHGAPWALTVKTNSVKHALDSAGKLETRGYRVRVTQVR